MKDYLVIYGQFDYGKMVSALDPLSAAHYVMTKDAMVKDVYKYEFKVFEMSNPSVFRADGTLVLRQVK